MPKSKRENNVNNSNKKIKLSDSSSDSSSSELDSSDDEEWNKPTRRQTRSMTKKSFKQLSESSDYSESEDEEDAAARYIEENYLDEEYSPPKTVKIVEPKLKLSPMAKEAIDEILETMLESAREKKNSARKKLLESKWKKNLSAEKAKKLQGIYNKISEKLDYVPTVAEILEADIPFNEKTNLVERLYILKNMQRDTFDYMNTRNALVSEIKKFKSYKISQDDYKKYENMSLEFEEHTEHLPIKFQILQSDLSNHNKRVVYKRYKDYANMSAHNHGKDDLLKWLKDAISIPNTIRKNKLENATDGEINLYLLKIKEALDNEIYGMEKAKEQILSEVHRRAKFKNNRGSVLGLTGPPGTGKTSIVNILSKILDIPVVKVSLNGVKDVSKLKGHSFTYISAMMGDIARALIEAKCKNPIIFFDEFDKAGNKFDQSVVSLLMQILDQSNNYKFVDEYLSGDYHVDLSCVWFICSMNDPKAQNHILMDRVKPLITIDGYTIKEKLAIVNKHFIPNSLRLNNFSENDIIFENEALKYLIEMTNEERKERSGVREIKSAIEQIIDNISMLRTNSAKSEKKLKLSYHIKKFKLPFTITKEVIQKLKPLPPINIYKFGMYT